jgi:serine/threonine protein kinase
MNILARGLSSVLYHPAFQLELADPAEKIINLTGTILKVTKKRCALQALLIKQHFLTSTTRAQRQHLLFPEDELISLTTLTRKQQARLWWDMNRFTKTFYTKEDFVVQPLAFGGKQWNTHFATDSSAETYERAKTQLLQAVLCLHANNVTHNDISERNVLIDANGNVNIIDWEFAVLHYDDESKKEPLLNNVGPFSFWRFTEVMTRYSSDFAGQVKGDWKRVWQILGECGDKMWRDVHNDPDLDVYVRNVLKLQEGDVKEKQAMKPKHKGMDVLGFNNLA